MLDRVLRQISSLFERREISSRRESWELPALFAIVLVGTVLRFWGLGNVGLHGDDEDTTALPAVHLAEHGTPEFPSGMVYVRAVAQTYMIAASILAFGESEWSIRLPSAVCGVVLIVLAYPLGRRFLTPVWNVGFVASVALLPELILMSQNARMYIFLIACVVALAILVIKWESSRNDVYGILGFVVMLIGLQFQTLMSLAAPVFLFPGILNGDFKRLLYGGLAIAGSLAGLKLIERWTMSFYPPDEFHGTEEIAGAELATDGIGPLDVPFLPTVAFGLLFAVVAWFVVRRLHRPLQKAAVGSGLLLGTVGQFAFQYHIALWVFAASAVMALRSELKTLRPIMLFAACSVALAVVHAFWLFWADVGTRGIVFATLMGIPSIWSFINLSALSVGAVLLAAAGLIVTTIDFARGQRLPDAWLYVLLAAVPALLVIGYAQSYPAPRYLLTTLPAILVAAFWASQRITEWIMVRAPVEHRHRLQGVAVLLVLTAVVNPVVLARVVNAGYDIHPDHDGAASYIRSQQLGPKDILVAEDVIVQTYYLGRVDYWLLQASESRRFVRLRDGKWREIYADTRLLGSSEELQALIDDPTRGDLYIVGSGELQGDGRLYMRGEAIQEILQSQESRIVYRGRDNGLTKVWRIPPKR